MDNENKDKVCILIVDDVEANRFILRNIIVEMGYQPVLAENGVQALKIFPKCRPQLILLDISMPEMDGFEFCKIMKSNADSRDVPIIFISAFDDESDIEKGFSLGGEDYVTRPFIPEEIKARVGVRLKLYDANQKLIESNRKLQMVVNEQLKQIEQEKKTVLYALANVARENSFYDEKHLERLQYNCKILGQAMQLSRLYEHIVSDTYIEALELSAPLCDVGNVAVPMEILKKKSHLTEGEMNIMKTHTTVGAKILQDISATGDYNDLVNKPVNVSEFTNDANYVTESQLETKQDTLVSGTNIKTINNQSLLGSGNIVFDTVPKQGSTNAITSGAVYEVLGSLETALYNFNSGTSK